MSTSGEFKNYVILLLALYLHKWDFCKWSARGYKSNVLDPYSVNTSQSTQHGHDPLHINSLDNGMLMCLDHHKSFDTFRFSIHPEVRSNLLVCFLLVHTSFFRPTGSVLSILLFIFSITNPLMVRGHQFIRIWSPRIQNFSVHILYQH